MSVKVKICGITRLEDALIATEAGADYLGFILWPHSKRAVSAQAARAITVALRQRGDCPTLVGVFVDRNADETARVLDECGLDLAQLSGQEPPSQVGDPQSPLYGRSYKALRPQTLAEAEAEAEWYAPTQPAPGQPGLLLDAYHPTLPGGTGRTTDWSMAAQLRESVPGLMLAGGLTPDNVVRAVAQVRPFAVDVASGVEAGPGIKDAEKVRRFIQRAKEGAGGIDG
ncbi:MAG TPA: phosphoribosylanthranilate isomerase [Candidatus Sulfomarinibacteraceae bacterium]|nr:phosphoribosylanthranilate isomerase [Candidatus Sulfomarinibacteraceae bacterium]